MTDEESKLDKQYEKTIETIDDLEMQISHLSYLLYQKKKYLEFLNMLYEQEETKC